MEMHSECRDVLQGYVSGTLEPGELEASILDPSDGLDAKVSHVRRFKQQACKFLACPSSYSAWPLLGKAGGTIMKRRLIML